MDVDWLEKRSHLFKKYCLPSIKNQKDDDFIWIIGIHPEFNPDFALELPQNAQLIKAKSSEEFNEKIKEMTKDFPISASCRLDSDDGISSNYTKSVNNFKNFFTPNKEIFPEICVLNFRTGCELEIESNEFHERDYPNSSFSILYSRKPDEGHHKLITDYHHAHIHKSMPTTNIQTSNPMWCITIHDCNVGNTLKGTINQDIKEKAQHLFNYT